MYEKVFGLTGRPFVSTPSVKRFFCAESVHAALDCACSTIERESGTVVVVGPTGCGKTLFLDVLKEQFKDVYRVVKLACAHLVKRQDLLQNILYELNLPYTGMSEGELRLSLIDYLRKKEECPNGVLILVDEADVLPVELLDEVRLLTNFVSEGRTRVQLVLAGSHRLEESLANPKLDSFNQRIGARCFLSHFTRNETSQFLQHSLDREGNQGREVFSSEAVDFIQEVSDGCPRVIIQLADHSMILAASTQSTLIDHETVQEAWADVQSLPNPFAGAAAHTSIENVESSEVEFGELEDATNSSYEPASNSHSETDEPSPVTSDSTTELDAITYSAQIDDLEEEILEVRPLSEFQNESVEAVQQSEWNVIEFCELDEHETDSLRETPDYEKANGEVSVYQFGEAEAEDNVTEIQQESSVEESVDSVEQPDSSEYRLAPEEPKLTPPLTLADFESVNSLLERNDEYDYQNVEQIDELDIGSDQFSSLARFLADEKSREELVEQQAEQSEQPAWSHSEADEWDSTEQVEDHAYATNDQPLDRDLESNPYSYEDEVTTVEAAETELVLNLGVEQSPESESVIDEVPSDYPNLFDEKFEEEELIADPYTKWVADQNTDSLEITREQLSILDILSDESVICQDDTEESETTSAEAPQETEDDDQPSDVAAEQTDEPATSETLLDEVMDKMRMDPPETHAPHVDSRQPATVKHPVSEVDHDDLLDTIQRQQDEIASQIIQLKRDLGEQDPHMETITTPQNNEETDALIEYGLGLVDSRSDDDKDMLIVSYDDGRRMVQSVREDRPEEHHPVSTGKAVRMNYKSLFNQLRNAE